MCGKELADAWYLLKHLEEHKERKERLFNCKLCNFTSIYDAEIRDHMIQHVENVSTTKLTQMEDKYEQQLNEQLDNIEESDEDLSDETNTIEEESNEHQDWSSVEEFISRLTKDTVEGKSIEDQLKIAEDYLSKCDQDGNYIE